MASPDDTDETMTIYTWWKHRGGSFRWKDPDEQLVKRTVRNRIFMLETTKVEHMLLMAEKWPALLQAVRIEEVKEERRVRKREYCADYYQLKQARLAVAPAAVPPPLLALEDAAPVAWFDAALVAAHDLAAAEGMPHSDREVAAALPDAASVAPKSEAEFDMLVGDILRNLGSVCERMEVVLGR